MSFDNLNTDLRSKILRQLNELGGESKLEVTGSGTVEVTLSVNVQFDIEFEDVEVASGSKFDVQLRKAILETPPGSEQYGTEPETVLALQPGNRVQVSSYDLQDAIAENLDYEIRSKAEDCLSAEYGAHLNHVEVEDIDVTDIFIENEEDLDRWNSDDDEELV